MMKNAKPAHALYGQPVHSQRLAPTDGAKLATASAPYLGRGKCMGNEDTCEGPKAKGTEYCIGHLRSMGQAK
jgi:hypothetical protein